MSRVCMFSTISIVISQFKLLFFTLGHYNNLLIDLLYPDYVYLPTIIKTVTMLIFEKYKTA